MNPVRSIKNQYIGINAHLHSLWQGRGGWNGFHTLYIGQLLLAHQGRLEQMGYTAEIEQSLQIRRVADVMEHDIDDTTFPALVVYDHNPETLERGEPVAWVELLSPSNKGNTPDAIVYNAKRRDILKSGLVFVEIDFLHETPPTFSVLPNEKPYRILVIDPRPRLQEGKLHFELFDIDDPIPEMKVPLNGDDQLIVEFAAPYETIFREALYGNRIDYTQFPVNFDHYTPADQTRIANRMLAVLEAARNGVDLETAPFPTKSLTLDDARAQLEQF